MPTQRVATRNGDPIPDDKLEALRRFAEQVVTTRGWPSGEAKRAYPPCAQPRAFA